MEREVVIGCYIIRKLIEAFKISDSKKDLACESKRFPNRKPVNYLNWYRVDQLYDMEQGAKASIPLRTLCNQVIHSYVFIAGEHEEEERGIFLASDHSRNQELIFVSLKEIVRLFRTTAQDYPNEIHRTLDPKTGKEKIIAQ